MSFGDNGTKGQKGRVATRQGKNIFFQVREMSGNFVESQGILEILQNVRELSGNFECAREWQLC